MIAEWCKNVISEEECEKTMLKPKCWNRNVETEMKDGEERMRKDMAKIKKKIISSWIAILAIINEYNYK